MAKMKQQETSPLSSSTCFSPTKKNFIEDFSKLMDDFDSASSKHQNFDVSQYYQQDHYNYRRRRRRNQSEISFKQQTNHKPTRSAQTAPVELIGLNNVIDENRLEIDPSKTNQTNEDKIEIALKSTLKNLIDDDLIKNSDNQKVIEKNEWSPSSSFKSRFSEKLSSSHLKSNRSSSQWSNRLESLLHRKSFSSNSKPNSSTSGNPFKSQTNISKLTFVTNRINSISNRNLLQEINDHDTGVNCLELSEDHSLLVSGGEDGVLRLWSTFSSPCELIGILLGHKAYITCCTVWKYLIISGSADCTIKIWSIENSECLTTLEGHQAFVNRIGCFDSLLVSSSFDNTVRVWSLTNQLTFITNADEEMEEKFLISAKRLDSSNIAKRLILKTQFGQCLHKLEGHEKSVTQVAIVQNPEHLENDLIQELDIVITTSTDGTIRTYNLMTGELRHVMEPESESASINCLAFDQNEPQLAYTAGADSIIRCWDVVTGDLTQKISGHDGPVLCMLSNNRILYSGSTDRTVRAWAMEFGQCTRVYYGSTAPVTCLHYFRGILCTGSNDHSVRLYDSNSAALKRTFSGHNHAISSLKLVQDKLFTASYDGKILVWDCSEIQKEIRQHQEGQKGDENKSFEKSTNNGSKLASLLSDSLPGVKRLSVSSPMITTPNTTIVSNHHSSCSSSSEYFLSQPRSMNHYYSTSNTSNSSNSFPNSLYSKSNRNRVHPTMVSPPKILINQNDMENEQKTIELISKQLRIIYKKKILKSKKFKLTSDDPSMTNQNCCSGFLNVLFNYWQMACQKLSSHQTGKEKKIGNFTRFPSSSTKSHNLTIFEKSKFFPHQARFDTEPYWNGDSANVLCAIQALEPYVRSFR